MVLDQIDCWNQQGRECSDSSGPCRDAHGHCVLSGTKAASTRSGDLLLTAKDCFGAVSWKEVSNLQSLLMSLLLSCFLVSSAFLGTSYLFLISGDIAKPVLPNAAPRTFSDTSLGAKICSDSWELWPLQESCLWFLRVIVLLSGILPISI